MRKVSYQNLLDIGHQNDIRDFFESLNIFPHFTLAQGGFYPLEKEILCKSWWNI